MTKNNTPQKIAAVTIVIAILGLIIQAISLLVSHSVIGSPVLAETFAYLTCVSSIQLSLFDIGAPVISPFLTILFQLMMIIGAIQILSGKRSKRILIAGYLLIFIQNVVYIPIVFYVILTREVYQDIFYVLLPIVRIAMLLIFSQWSYSALKNLIGTRDYKKTKYGEGEQAFYQIEDVSKRVRFLNYFSDFFLIIMSLGSIFRQVIDFVNFFGNETLGFVYKGSSNLTLFIIFTCIQLVYYLLADAVFSATPGKVITGTFVVDVYGNPATTKQLIGRCFARFIPFDALSFLAGTGWHDLASRTTVVKQEDIHNSPFITPDADGVIRYTG